MDIISNKVHKWRNEKDMQEKQKIAHMGKRQHREVLQRR